jgi:hypothetical protein
VSPKVAAPVALGPPAAPPRRDWIVFLLLLFTYAYFFQGGGWNQNSRFDQLRAVVEQGRLSINDTMLFRGELDEDGRPVARPVTNTPGVPLDRVRQLANTEDVARMEPGGRFYPNKPPGAVMLALPGYFAVYGVERLLGVEQDHWRTLTLNHYLATLLSVGLLGALGGLLFLRTSRRLSPAAPFGAHAASALTFGLGTLMLPYATVLFDHVTAAVLLLASFHWLIQANEPGQTPRRGSICMLLAGAAAGMSVVVNYVCAGMVLLLAGYALWQHGLRRRTALFLLGGAPFALLLAAYHQVCFGSPFATANVLTLQSGRLEGMALGGFNLPSAEVAWKLLFGTRRGLFFTSPVMVLALAAAVPALKERAARAAAIFSLAVFGFYWIFNASFEHWHAGFAIGPRYMIPALPFACIWLARSFHARPRLTLAVAGVSLAILLFATAVDPQPPLRFSNPLFQYLLPLAADGSVTIESIRIEGPVSANPIGTWEGWYYRIFPYGSAAARWSSFNLGELLWPRSLLSLLPLALALATGFWLIARQEET